MMVKWCISLWHWKSKKINVDHYSFQEILMIFHAISSCFLHDNLKFFVIVFLAWMSCIWSKQHTDWVIHWEAKEFYLWLEFSHCRSMHALLCVLDISHTDNAFFYRWTIFFDKYEFVFYRPTLLFPCSYNTFLQTHKSLIISTTFLRTDNTFATITTSLLLVIILERTSHAPCGPSFMC